MSTTSIGVNLRVTGHCSQGGRKYMEDFFSVAYQQSEDEKDLEYAFFGIYDGHGGSEAATYAKEHLMNAIVNQKLFWSDCDQDILRAIREGYISTHYAMWREQEKWPKTATGLPSTAGTTASVAFIRRGKIYIGHVGDSGIVLGYQEENEKFWRAKPLTHDHKPECNVEKARIINSGGKVVTKSGVPRVVWNRPRIGHKGPVRRSTPIDEIPFLAVARSLGDLWSYNSALNEFVVSPNPDVKVVKIDPKTFRCLIFGTDGLWNVLSASDAVDLARDAEIVNEKLLSMGGTSEWKNPSKCLVDKALEKWCMKKMRADNTSVVAIMLDPPGTSRKDFKSCSSASYNLDYVRLDNINNCEYVEDNMLTDYPMLDNSTVAMYAIDQSHSVDSHTENNISTPSSGYAIMTRYDNNCDSNILCYENFNDTTMSSSNVTSPITHCSSSNAGFLNNTNSNNEIQYMNSFAESYNSLLISSFEDKDDLNTNQIKNYIENKEYNNYNFDESGTVEQDQTSFHHPYSLHQQQHMQYQQQSMSVDEGYSLTKLETRCEQKFRQQHQSCIKNLGIQNSIKSIQELNEENQFNQYDSITSSYQQQQIVQVESFNENKTKNLESNLVAPKTVVNHNEFMEIEKQGKCEENFKLKNECSENVEHTTINDSVIEESSFNANVNQKVDESIQINEISSSVTEISAIDDDLVTMKPLNIKNKKNSLDSNKYNQERTQLRTKSSIKMLYQNKVTKRTKRAKSNGRHKSFLFEQNENILTLEPRKLRSTVNYNKRNLRSREFVIKDIKFKSENRKQSNIRRNVNNYLKLSNLHLSNTYSRTRHIHPQVQREELQRRSKTFPILHRTADSSSIKRNNSVNRIKPKTSCNISKSQSKILTDTSISVSSCSVSSSSSSLMVSSSSSTSKRSSSRNSAWCSGKSVVQTRNRVQKRISH